jgi:hypothetical protein
MATVAAATLVVSIVGLTAQAIGGVVSANNARETGKMQSDIILDRAKEEEQIFREQGESIKSTQQAFVGASGVETEGSPLMVMEKTASQIENDALKIREEGRRSAALVRKQGADAANTQMINTAATLLTGGAQLYNAFSGNYGQQKKSYTYQNKYPSINSVNLGRPSGY